MGERFLRDRVELLCGDCREQIATLADDSIDAVVTDPPYSLVSIVKRFGNEGSAPAQFGSDGRYARASAGFMGQRWDTGEVAFDPEFWAEVLRVLKPGGHVLAMGGTRTYHRLACAIEDAGFEIRDCVMWVYGSGFPKSHDVSKGIDKAAPRNGMFAPFAAHYAERRAATCLTHNAICAAGKFYAEHNHGGASVNWEKGHNVPTVEQWNVLQPLLGLSDEWLPLIERVEAERQIIGEKPHSYPAAHMNASTFSEVYDASRVHLNETAPATDAARQWQGWGTALKPAVEPIVLARKPLSEGTIAANVLEHGTGALNIDACRIEGVKGVPGSVSQSRPDGRDSWRMGTPTADMSGRDPNAGRWPANIIHDGSEEVVGAFPDTINTDDGKPRPRLAGSEFGQASGWNEHNNRDTVRAGYSDSGSAARFFYQAKADSDDRLGSKHPTVKPLDLMQYLCRLITPPGGTVLDPFSGTGTTGEAAYREGMRAVLIEREEEYQEDIRRRMALVLSGPDERSRESMKEKQKGKPRDDGPLFASEWDRMWSNTFDLTASERSELKRDKDGD